jgi:hypothetical protein
VSCKSSFIGSEDGLCKCFLNSLLLLSVIMWFKKFVGICTQTSQYTIQVNHIVHNTDILKTVMK